MAIRRHIVAARNTTPEAFTAALAGLNVSEVEEANGWCWAMASVWTTGADDLVKALGALDGPGFLTTTEDGCRWRLHIRAKGIAPFDTVHEFQWIGSGAAESEIDSDWGDLDEDEAEGDVGVVSVELPGFPAMPTKRLPPLDFEDDYFEAYSDENDDDLEDGEDEWRQPSPLEYIAECYRDSAIPLPATMVAELAGVPVDEIYPRFLALHGAFIADALARFSIPHDREEVLRILTGENLSSAERESDIGNLWRFLHHLGLGPKFAEALEEFERVETPQPPEDPALRIIRAAGKLPLHKVEGGPAPIPLSDVFLMARLTSFQDTYPEFTATLRFDSPVDWPTGRTPGYATCAPVKKGFGANLSLQGMDVPTQPKARRRLGELVATVPEGARLELLAKGPCGKTRLVGRVAGDAWLLESASAPMSTEDVRWMLELFRGAESRAPVTARDESEVEAVLHGAAQHMVLCNDPPRREGLQLYPGDRRETEVLCGLFFRHRLKDRWDFSKIERHNATKFRDWRKFEEEMARENALPATENVIYAGESSRFLEADYKAKSMDTMMRAKAKTVRETDKEMAELGYRLLGAVVCEKVGGGILRCYANATEKTYSTNYLLPYGQQWHDYTSRFKDDTCLTTGNGLSEGSLRSLRILARHSSGTTLGEMRDEHREGVERLVGHGLSPAEIDVSLEGVCRAMDEFLTRRLGLDSEE